MKNKIFKAPFIIAAILFAVAFTIGYLQHIQNDQPNTNNYIYSGKIAFDNKDSYSQFKHELIRQDVKINSISEIDADYPIIVSFSVDVPFGGNFSYGDRYQYAREESAGFVLSGILTTAAFIVALYGMVQNTEPEESQEEEK